MRTHMILPDDLVTEVDRFVGKGKRSKFIEEAVAEKLRAERLLKALDDTAGILSDHDYPEWSTVEKVAAWVHDLRREGDRTRKEKLGRD